ncbi:MAG TPA: hypothetical protein VFA59_04470 [Vicinamibacterales bacterium]|nr:hypothetical protein [Vicinamibacterales bacterium]
MGAQVRAADGQAVGRIEEIRVARRNNAYEVTEYLLGPGALRERLAQHLWFGRRRKSLIAKWDQLDIRRPERPTLLCAAEELTRG